MYIRVNKSLRKFLYKALTATSSAYKHQTSCLFYFNIKNSEVEMESGSSASSDLVFSDIPEEQDQQKVETEHNIQVEKKRVPKRILHFSDGILEEYSSEDEEDTPVKTVTSEVNPKTLPWGPWMWYQTVAVGTVSLQVCDYLGENLASFLGITSPKYQYEIDEYNREVAEEQERKKRRDLEMGGWTSDNKELTSAVQVAPPQEQDHTML